MITSVIVADKDHDSFKQTTYLALTSLNQWFYIIQLVLNITKTNVIKFTPKTAVRVPFVIYYKDILIDEVKSIKFFRYACRQSYELEKACLNRFFPN
jgi:hypothetical protein